MAVYDSKNITSDALVVYAEKLSNYGALEALVDCFKLSITFLLLVRIIRYMCWYVLFVRTWGRPFDTKLEKVSSKFLFCKKKKQKKNRHRRQ